MIPFVSVKPLVSNTHLYPEASFPKENDLDHHFRGTEGTRVWCGLCQISHHVRSDSKAVGSLEQGAQMKHKCPLF